MKKSDLHRKWARVLDMCEGTKVKPRDCWKYNGKFIGFEPEFTDFPDSYEFMVAILEGKPVFAGDKVWLKNGGGSGIVTKEWANISDDMYSWSSPKKTFALNGEELPCPTKISDNPLSSAFLIGGQAYHFSNWDDCLKVQAAIHKLLQDATK